MLYKGFWEYYFVGIDKARFKKQVYPGDILTIHAKLNQSKREIHKFTADCKIDNEVVCTADLLGAVRNKNDSWNINYRSLC